MPVLFVAEVVVLYTTGLAVVSGDEAVEFELVEQAIASPVISSSTDVKSFIAYQVLTKQWKRFYRADKGNCRFK